jgi:hypothetical protein
MSGLVPGNALTCGSGAPGAMPTFDRPEAGLPQVHQYGRGEAR